MVDSMLNIKYKAYGGQCLSENWERYSNCTDSCISEPKNNAYHLHGYTVLDQKPLPLTYSNTP